MCGVAILGKSLGRNVALTECNGLGFVCPSTVLSLRTESFTSWIDPLLLIVLS
jgi:hypothetical protein